jgi:predicted neuraminidase
MLRQLVRQSAMGLTILATAVSLEAGDPVYVADFIIDPEDRTHGHVHASTIVECPNGDLRAVWYENGTELPEPRYYTQRKDKSDDVRIGGSRRPAGTDQWEPPFVMSDTFGTSDNNPTMCVDSEGRLWLIHPVMLGTPKWTWGSSILQYKISSDYDQAGPPPWERTGLLIPHPLGFDQVFDKVAQQLESEETRAAYGLNKTQAAAYLGRLRHSAEDPMRLRLGWMPRVHPLVRADGTLVVPLSNENFNIPMMAMTADGGKTWNYSEPVPAIGLIQPSLVQFPDGEMQAYFRNSDPRHRINRSTSTDGGQTWSEPELTELLHPGGGIEAVLLDNGHLAVVYNNKEDDPRDKLAVSISSDRGQTWDWTRELENTPGSRFDYPSLIQTADGLLHVTYSYNLETIKHVQFNEEWVQAGG